MNFLMQTENEKNQQLKHQNDFQVRLHCSRIFCTKVLKEIKMTLRKLERCIKSLSMDFVSQMVDDVCVVLSSVVKN